MIVASDREFWLTFRRALLMIDNAIARRYGLPLLIELEECASRHAPAGPPPGTGSEAAARPVPLSRFGPGPNG